MNAEWHCARRFWERDWTEEMCDDEEEDDEEEADVDSKGAGANRFR